MRVFTLIESQDVTCKMVDWMKTSCESTGCDIVAFDGKALRRSESRKEGLKILSTVGAWVTQ